ncbi:MarR family transcriptional regulator [Nocardioides sp. AE5]|uniref:MarR family winged helix-turn-helix transcriptional regulator n=1 Tax=Nocardioides sp. AE5 TaxID=2962573 RepID=UPI002882437D|nr:MarR family transcriptional regulator [Nocardioides sp. AE5]MDT0201327.1 MarR family transcriptional regulator [Nocardioides sp. AE5]
MSENPTELLMAAARQLRSRHGAALAPWQVTPAQARALRLVCRLDAPRPSELARRLRIAPRSATEVIDALQERGLVVREQDAGDRRAICIRPTPEGEAMNREIDAARREAADAFLAVLAPADRAELDRILAILVDQPD